ncbi:MAG: cytochrome c oxidase subunit II [Gemmatimonadaceae bacterium]|nr:cytochrome c oxidase subunit II [Acetobacteraceae bacterium]
MQGFPRLRTAAFLLTMAAGLTLAGGDAAWAEQPRNWQLGFQAPGSPVQQGIEGLHALVLWLMAAVTIFVAALLGYCMWRFRASKNPRASRVSHHTALEVAWTVIPVLILVVIAIPSFRLIYFQDRTEAADMTIKVTGHQWYWAYEYPDQGSVKFNSYMIPSDEIKPGQLRQLEVDNRVVLPAGKNIRILATSGDVIHSFFVPSLGVQRYAIPGRTIETWVRIDKPGVYYGQCNQICGTQHSGMPIAVEAMTDQNFAAWIETAKTKFAAAPADGSQRVATIANTPR